MEGKQGFLKGMDQDASNNKRNLETYFEAHNFRVVTDEGGSTGALENEKGTKLAFKVPDLEEMILDSGSDDPDISGEIIPPQSGLHIIGSTTMVDSIIIFTTAETSATPSGSYGQIWQMEFDEASGTIVGLLPGNFLDPNVHLMYNQALNFSTEYRIGRAIALYENEKKQRVYWTDNFNPLRVFNLADPDPLNVPLDTVNVFPGSSLSQPVIKSIGVGNVPSGPMIQFTYKLLNLNGGETTYAPPTPLYAIPQQGTGATEFTDFHGAGTANSRSVTYEIQGLDTSYDAIQHIAIIYNQGGGLGNIWLFSEDSVPASGEIEVVCSSLSNAIAIPIEEYSVINLGFDRCKDIEVQGNRLIAANIRTAASSFELNFDTRAYRFNNSQQALLKDSNSPIGTVTTDDVVLSGAVPIWSNVPETHDAINLYNSEANASWFTDQYKYQTDGVTLGGEGPNISYKFVEFENVGANASTFTTIPTNAPSHITVPGYPVGTSPVYKGVLQSDGSLQPTYRENQTDSTAAPWIHSNFRGYARGEVYRFGIVFYNKQSIPSFVQWIGDIKFPDVNDGFPLHEFSSNTMVLKQLGIEFDVDVSSISSEISGYSIVRLDRRPEDRTRISTGYHMFTNNQRANHQNSLFHRYWNGSINGTYSGANSDNPFPVCGCTDYFGSTQNIAHLCDRPGYGNNANFPGNEGMFYVGFLVSPLGNTPVGNIAPGATDYIETLGYVRSLLHNYYYDDFNTGQGDTSLAFYYKLKDFAYPQHDIERLQIHTAQDVVPSYFFPTGGAFLSDIDYPWDLANISYSRDSALFVSNNREHHPFGIGNSKRFFTLKGSTPTTQPNINHMSTSKPEYEDPWAGVFEDVFYYGPEEGTSITFQPNARAADQEFSFKLVGYRRYLVNQYGGDSYESRSTNEYQYIGHHQIMTVGADNLTFQVFGGDVSVNYTDIEYLNRYNSQAVQDPLAQWKPSDINKLGIAVCAPIESVINTNYRGTTLWAKDRDANNIDFYSFNNSQYNLGWNQDDEVQREFFSEDFLSQLVEEFPHQLWASDIKIYGELSDSWRSFPIANKIDVDGIYGPINRIMSFKDNLMFYQDSAVGIASLDERSVMQDDSGQELVLGIGGVFPDYKYLSTITGSVHQFDVIQSETAAYHYDARLRKLFRFSGGLQPLTDVKGMSSFFDKNVIGAITDTDKTLSQINPRTGVHATYDPRYNRVLFTFLNNKAVHIDTLQNEDGSWTIPAGTYFVNNLGTTFLASATVTVPASTEFIDWASFREIEENENSFTVSYNELTQSFESFYDYHPGMYLEYGRRLLSVSPFATNEMHTHNIGNYGEYYDQIQSTSKLFTKLSNHPDVNKIFNNYAYLSELYDTTGEDIFNETFDRVQFKSNYQDTGVIPLTVNTNIKRRMRTWRGIIPRDENETLSRMRNSWLDCILEYDNNENKRLILHDLMYSFTPTKL